MSMVVPDRGDVGDGRPAWHEDEIGGAGGREGRVRGVWGGVDDGQARAGGARRLEDGGQLGEFGRGHHGGGGLSEFAPFRSGPLRVEIDEHCRESGVLGGDGEGAGNGRLARAAFLAGDRNHKHRVKHASTLENSGDIALEAQVVERPEVTGACIRHRV